jgi:hypothetical protein
VEATTLLNIALDFDFDFNGGSNSLLQHHAVQHEWFLNFLDKRCQAQGVVEGISGKEDEGRGRSVHAKLI